GGAIDLRFGTLFRTPDSVIDASAGPAGIDGTVRLEGPEENVSGGLTALPATFLDASALLRESCAARRDVGTSSFTASGRGGLPVGPDAPLPGFYALGREVPLAGAAAALAGSKPPPLVFEVAGLDRACGGVR
ncbi:MAG TPA: hypothetical protein VFG47_12630, partial [Geminicoccaceae bacterium]|nr:hypothetical protein [Geminicoccaceae bacterium]